MFTSAPEKNSRLRPILSTIDSECLLTVHLSTSLQEGRPMNTSTRVLAVTAAASFAVFGVVGCSSDDNDSSTATSSAAMTSSAMGSGMSPSSAMPAPAPDLLVPGCAHYADVVRSAAGPLRGLD